HRGQRAAVWLLWALLGLALLAAVGYAVVSVRPEIAAWASVPSAQTDPEVAAVVSADAPRPLGEPLPFSVQVTAFQNFEAARDRLFELREMAPTVLFFVSPEEMRGVVYYRIFAGGLPDIDVA